MDRTLTFCFDLLRQTILEPAQIKCNADPFKDSFVFLYAKPTYYNAYSKHPKSAFLRFRNTTCIRTMSL